MDIDTAVQQLRAIMEDKKGGLVDATAAAPKLLRLPRYKVDDGHALLASDIEAAIARLPRGTADEARHLLPIHSPGSSLGDRWDALGAGKSSSPARRWRWTSVFTRVAIEFLALQSDHRASNSYRVRSLHIHHTSFGSDGRAEKPHQTITFDWHIESLVDDLRWFAFSYDTGDLPYWKWWGHGHGVDGIARTPVVEGIDGNHWYVMKLDEPAQRNQVVRVVTTIWLRAESLGGVKPWVAYVVTEPLDTLILTATLFPHTQPRFRCLETDVTTGRTLDDYTTSVDEGVVPEEIRALAGKDRPPLFYVPPTPSVGHAYRLSWDLTHG